MSDSESEYVERKRMCKEQHRARVEWLKKANFPYDELINLTAAVMCQGMESAKEIERLEKRLNSINHIHELLALVDHPKFSTTGILALIDKSADNDDEDDDYSGRAAKSIKKAIAVTNMRHKAKSKDTAVKGGKARAKKINLLETETIRLFEAGKWKNAPSAALEITPTIVAMSKKGNGDLLDSTTKPLEWIRAYIKSQKSDPN